MPFLIPPTSAAPPLAKILPVVLALDDEDDKTDTATGVFLRLI